MDTRVIETMSETKLATRHEFAEYEAIFQKSPQGAAVLDHELRYIRVNDAFANFLDLPKGELIGRRLVETLAGLPEELGSQNLPRTEQGQSPVNLKVTLAGSDSTGQRVFEGQLYPLESSETSDLGFGLLMVEVTEKERVAKGLQSSEARYRDAVEHSIYGVCCVDSDGKASGANRAMLRILGCSSHEELATIDFRRDIFRFADQQAELLAACRKDGWVRNANAEWRRRDGGFVAVRLQLRELRTAECGNATEIMAEDVTELRALERQLQQAQKFEAIGQLAGGIAHDFNNVIGAIIGWAELGADGNWQNGQAADRFLKIREQAERAASITKELLAFARRQVLQPRAVDLNSVVNGLATFLARVIGRDIAIEVCEMPLDAVKADPTQVEQVVMNLCLNARDAMPNGGRLLIESGMVEVDESYTRFYPGIAAGRYAVLSVSDTGSGMEAETLERVFEPFFTTKENGKGTGLGLATVYGIVKQHGGFVHVYSEPAHGSLFRVYFPAVPGAVAAKSLPALPSVGEMRGNETILIAEDHESIREMARQTLAHLGYRVLCAADGEEALQLSQQAEPAVAVLDVVMPRLGGPAAAKQLLNQFPGLKIIFTSGYSRDRDQRTAELAHSAYLQKPYSPTILGRLVRDVLDGSHPSSV